MTSASVLKIDIFRSHQFVENVKTKRILIIDDEDNVRIVVKACLENLSNWEVLLAACGQEGLAIAKIENPDAILLDITMPGMNGLAVLQKLKADTQTQSIPVIFLTARANYTEPQYYLPLGARGAIVKPFEPFALVKQIAAFLE